MTNARQDGPLPFVWAIVAVFCAAHLIMWLMAAGYIGSLEIYREIYVTYAFWDILFEAWWHGEDVPLDILVPSFVTYSFIHSSVLHLAMNSVIFLALGGAILRAVGTLRFLVIFVGTAAAGSATFGVLAEAQGPLLGASGVIFGFFGVLKQWEWRYIAITGTPANRFWGTIAGLVLINVALALIPVLSGNPGAGFGLIAWQTHLGGFIAGWALANILTPNHAGPSPI
ncbi:MAG: rhomboid family intramembrane serine protease [Pikeienuella sp.]